MKSKKSVSILAVIANLLLAIGKIVVGAITKSASILADGINSSTDVIASILSYIGIRVAEKPADKEHPYGHGKAEVIAGFLITIIIFLSALWIIYDAIRGFFLPKIVEISYFAFGIMAFSALVNGVMSKVKIHYGKKHDSVSLISDGIHSRIDFLVSAGIFIGLFFVRYYVHVDSIIALLVGVYILKEAFKLGKETTDSLLGTNAGEETENKIEEISKQNKTKITNLKTQKIGSKIFAELKVELPSKIKVDQATATTKRLEKELLEKINNLEYVSIQIESHDFSTSYYRPGFGKGFGWQRGGRMKGRVEDAKGSGPGGYCVCSKCGYKIKHERGKPCSAMKCPKCDGRMKREE
jgi:cation diffusion facilitator family transporter